VITVIPIYLMSQEVGRMERTAEERGERGVEAVPAEVDLSGLSVEQARFALGRLRAAVAAARQAGRAEGPDWRGRPRAPEACVV
jgi:hypothetical protein